VTATRTAVDRAHIEAFARDGFVVVENLFEESELDEFGPAVDRAVADEQSADTRPLAHKSRYQQSFMQCQYLWMRSDGVRRFSCHPRLARAAAELLGAEAVRMWHDQALYKEPGGRRTDAHQDHAYWPLVEPSAITAWVPLDGSTRETGAMGYYPGSHRSGLDRFVNIFADDDPEDLADDPVLAATEPVIVEVPKGSVAFHHARTAHFALANESDRVRRVHTVIYIADGTHRGADGRHISVDFDGIRPGEVVAGQSTPILWPRPHDDLPDPPPGGGDAIVELFKRLRGW
jgi:ectoine hydroxylase-related dioxygenase (phytanoyl-CoA dioxygenase family)